MRHLRSLTLLLASSFVLGACGGGSQAQPKGLPTCAVVPKVTPPGPPARTADEDAPIPVNPNDATRGEASAPVTLVVFSDFQCPFCAKMRPTLERLASERGTSQVRVVFKNQPLSFHTHARRAAEAGQGVLETAGPAAFWKFHDLAFDNQRELSPETLVRWAVQAGADGKTIAEGLESGRWAAKIDEDVALAERIGANGTPTTFINGFEVGGAQPYARFAEIVDAELAKANAKLADGTPKDRLYAVMTAENLAGKGAREAEVEERRDREERAEGELVWKVPVGTSPALGPKDAIVTIVEFSDFQCPYCKRVEPTMKELRETYKDKLRVVWKHQPLSFHKRAEPAAELTLEARAQRGDKGFWAAHGKVFAASPALEDEDLAKIARELGLDVKKVEAAIASKKHQKTIDEDVALATEVKASGTPHFFINGRRLVGAKPAAEFKRLIDEEIAKFEAQKGKGGVAAKDWYESRMKEAKTQPALPPPSRPSPTTPPIGQTATGRAPTPPGLAKDIGGGLYVKDVVSGSGAEVKAGDKVTVHYVGTLKDGTEFDASRKHGRPFTFQVGQGMVIKGWDQGLVGMKVGGKRVLTIPPDLAYGDRGVPGAIPPKSMLEFEIELLGIETP